jgi:hypothetical protein
MGSLRWGGGLYLNLIGREKGEVESAWHFYGLTSLARGPRTRGLVLPCAYTRFIEKEDRWYTPHDDQMLSLSKIDSSSVEIVMSRTRDFEIAENQGTTDISRNVLEDKV